VKANVLQLVDSFNQGGSERQAVQLAEMLRRDGTYRVFLGTLNKEGVLLDKVEKIGFHPVPHFPLTSFYDSNFVRQIKACVRFIRENDVRIVHTHDFYTNIFGMTAAFLAGVPVRIASRRETTGTRTPMQKRIERSSYRLAHAILANAGAVRRQLIDEGVSDRKIEVVYNGVDWARVSPRADVKFGTDREPVPKELGLPIKTGQPVVTIVANFRLDVKDHPTFLRAARRVRESVPGAAFVLAGEGGLLEPMRRYAAELGLGEAAVFAGQRDSVAEILDVSNVGVLSSKAEGLSNAILEYMAARLPVVATDVGGARELVVEGETGHLVEVGDDAAMAARIIDLLNDPEKARAMGERGRQLIETKFSCSEQLHKTSDLYNRLLTRNGE
jgi:glycosyltransferase involved in cell wall biosynthesis